MNVHDTGGNLQGTPEDAALAGGRQGGGYGISDMCNFALTNNVDIGFGDIVRATLTKRGVNEPPVTGTGASASPGKVLRQLCNATAPCGEKRDRDSTAIGGYHGKRSRRVGEKVCATSYCFGNERLEITAMKCVVHVFKGVSHYNDSTLQCACNEFRPTHFRPTQ